MCSAYFQNAWRPLLGPLHQKNLLTVSGSARAMSNTEPKEDPASHTQDEPLLQSVARALGTAVGVVASALTPSANEGENGRGKTKHEQRAEPSTQSRISRRSMNKKAKKKKHRRKLRRSHTNG